MECVELAPAFEPRHTSDSGSKLHALHTLRETRPPLSSVCAICSVSPENLRKKTRFSPILFSAPAYAPATRRPEDSPRPALMQDEPNLRRRIKILTAIFMLGLIISGATAIPLVAEVDCLANLTGASGFTSGPHAAPTSVWAVWLTKVQNALHSVADNHSF